MKVEQRLVIEKVVHGRDVFAQLPTGFGKSLTFQILPPPCKCLKSMGHNFPSNPLLVIVSPLLPVMEDQVKWPRPRGFAAAYIGESNYKDRNITVKTLIQDHPFSEFRLIGFLYIGYFR